MLSYPQHFQMRHKANFAKCNCHSLMSDQLCIPYGCTRKYQINSASFFKTLTNDLSEAEYTGLNLHTPYGKRNLIPFAIYRHKNGENTHKNNVVPENNVFDLMDISARVSQHLKERVYNEAKATMKNNWIYILRIVIKIMKVVRLAIDKAYMALILEFLDFGLEAANWLYDAKTKPTQDEIVAKTMQCLQTFLPSLVTMFNNEQRGHDGTSDLYAPESNTHAKTAITGITALSVAISIIATFAGYNGKHLKTLGDNVRSSKDVTTNISTLITSLFNIDIDGTGELQTSCKELEEKGMKYAELPIRQYTSSQVREIRLWKTSAEDFCRVANKMHVNTGTLISQLQKISEKLIEVEAHRQENIAHPVPVSMYLWGPAGYGKTEFLTKYLISGLNTKFGIQGSRGEVFDLGSGKYFKTVQDECWAKFDEFGATTTPQQNGLDTTTLNAMISGYASTIPGASLAAKQQTARFNGIFFLSNVASSDAALGLRPEAKNAFMSRLMRLQVCDPNYDKGSDRTNQVHRQADFSHLQFKLMSAKKYSHLLTDLGIPLPQNTDDALTLTPPQVVELAAAQIIQNQANFTSIHAGRNPAFTRTPYDLWEATPEIFEETRIPVTWISGPPGTGKSSTLKPRLVANAQAMGLQVAYEYSPRQDEPTMFILDDRVSPHLLEGQMEFMNFYNTCKTSDCIVVISNYGRHSTPFSYVRDLVAKVPVVPALVGRLTHKPEYLQDPCPPIYRLEPGFWRRSGLADRHYEYYGGKAYDIQGNVYEDNDAILQEISQHYINNREIPLIHETPFPRDVEWDVDINVPPNVTLQGGIDLVMSAAKTQKGAAQIPRVLQLVRSQATLPPAVQLCGMIRQLAPEICVRIRTPNYEYAAVKGEFFSVGIEPSQLGVLGDKNFQLKVCGAITDVPVNDFRKMLAGDGDFQPKYASVLASVIAAKGADYEQLMQRYPPPISQRVKKWTAMLTRSALSLFATMLEYPLLVVAIVTGAVLMVKFRTSWFKTYNCVCREVAPDELCPFDYPEARGKGGKGRKAGTRHTHFKKVFFNGRYVYEDDAVDNQSLDRIWHNIGVGARQGKTNITMKQGDHTYQATFDQDDLTWHITAQDEPEIYLSETKLFKAMSSNIAKIQSCAADMFTTFITPSIAVVPAHWFIPNTSTHSTVVVDGVEYPVKELRTFPEREIAFIQTYVPIPGMKNLLKYIPTLDEIRGVTRATIVHKRGEGIDTETNRYIYKETPAARFSSVSLQRWTTNCGLVSWGDGDGQFTRPGSCGSPTLTNIDGTARLIGVHAAKSHSQRHWVSVVLCQELLSEIADLTAESMDMDSRVGVVNTDWALKDAMPVVVPQVIKDLISPKKRMQTVIPCNALQAVGFIDNKKPMDSKCKKKKTYDFPMTTANFDQKAPALDEIDIMVHHRDKIPTDAVGNAYVHRIRTARLESNWPLVAKDHLKLLAKEMAAYYSIHFSKLNILSIEEALVGSMRVESVDMDTSAGVVFGMIAGIRVKQDFLDHENKPLPILTDYTQEQFDLAKIGMRLALPCDANLKSECLPVEKVWKKRVFYNVPLPTVLNLKRLLQPIQAAFQKMGIKSPYLFTLDPVKDWNALGMELREQGNFIVSLDVSSYDHSLNGSVIEALAEYFTDLYGCTQKESTNLNVIFRVFMQEVAYMITIFDKTVCQKQGGLPSGCWGTSLIDAAAWELMLYACWKNLAPNDYKPFSIFKAHVTAKFVGDDAIISVGPFAREFFHGITIARQMKDVFHMKVTPATNKDGILLRGTTLERSSFCSKAFVKLPEHPSTWFPRLKEASIYGALRYTNEASPILLYEQYIALRRDIFTYGRQRYNTYERELNAFAMAHGIVRHTFMTYDDMVHSAWRLTTSPGINSNHERVKTVPTAPTKIVDLSHLTSKMSSRELKALKARLFQVAHDTCSETCANAVAPNDVKLLGEIPEQLISPEFQTVKVLGTGSELKVMQMGSICALRAYFADFIPDATCPLALDQHYFLSKCQTDKALRNNECIRETSRLAFKLKRTYTGPKRGGLYFLRASSSVQYPIVCCTNCGNDSAEPECNYSGDPTDEPEFDLDVNFIDDELEDMSNPHTAYQIAGGFDTNSYTKFDDDVDTDTDTDEDTDDDDCSEMTIEGNVHWGPSSWCCDRKCFQTPWGQVDGIACRTCNQFNYCMCRCTKFQEGQPERQRRARARVIKTLKEDVLILQAKLVELEALQEQDDTAAESAPASQTPGISGTTADRGSAGTASASVAGSTQIIDPLAAPALTATPAVSLVSQELTDSDNANIPTILASQGGLEAVGLVPLNYADNVVSLMQKPIISGQFNITASMSAGTIIDSFEFNPWDELNVSEPIKEYGNLHNVFVGGLNTYLQSYSASTIVGAIIISYVPPELVANFNPSLANLKTLSSATLNLKEGGCSMISFTGGNLQDSAVSRQRIKDGICYGKMYIAALTDIVNAFPNEIPIPVVKLCSLGAGAYFSHPAYLSPIGGTGPSNNPGPMPVVPLNFLVDGQGALPLFAHDGGSEWGWTNYGKSDDAFTFMPSCLENNKSYESGKGEVSVLNYWYWGSTKYGSNPSVVEANLPNPGSKADRSGLTDGFASSQAGPYAYGNMEASWAYSGLTMDDTNAGHATLEIGDQAGHVGYTSLKGTETQLFVEIISNNYVDGYWPDVICKLLRAWHTDFVYFKEGDKTWHPLRNVSADEKQVKVKLGGFPIASDGPLGVKNPNGYVSLNPDTSLPFIPAVGAGFTQYQSTMFTSPELIKFMTTARIFFQTNNVLSYSYDLVTSQGTRICTVLVNKDGMFAYTPAPTLTSAYGLLDGLTGSLFQNYQQYNTKFPTIPALNTDYFTTRVKGTKMSVARDLHGKMHTLLGDASNLREWNKQLVVIRETLDTLKRESSEKSAVKDKKAIKPKAKTSAKDDTKPEGSVAMIGAMMGGGLLSGLGQGLGTWGASINQWKQLEATLKSKQAIADQITMAQKYSTDERIKLSYAQLAVKEAGRQNGYGGGRVQVLKDPYNFPNYLGTESEA